MPPPTAKGGKNVVIAVGRDGLRGSDETLFNVLKPRGNCIYRHV